VEDSREPLPCGTPALSGVEVLVDITAVNYRMNVPDSAVPDVPPERAAENRIVVQAVKAVNGAEIFGQDNNLTFRIDPGSKRLVIQVVNQKTHEVLLQIPQEYVLSLAEDLKK
jgi:hypothetical protein